MHKVPTQKHLYLNNDGQQKKVYTARFFRYQLRPLYNICTIVVQYLYNW